MTLAVNKINVQLYLEQLDKLLHGRKVNIQSPPLKVRVSVFVCAPDENLSLLHVYHKAHCAL